MAACLWIISLLAYGFTVLSFVVGRSDIQIIAAGVFATCGTVALVGAAVVARLPPPPPVYVKPPQTRT